MKKVPLRFKEFTTTYPAVSRAYEELARQCHETGPLNDRDRALVKIGIAAGSNVEGSVNSQVRKALDLGIRPDEIRHAIMLSLTAIGFPRMMAALAWAENILSDQSEK